MEISSSPMTRSCTSVRCWSWRAWARATAFTSSPGKATSRSNTPTWRTLILPSFRTSTCARSTAGRGVAVALAEAAEREDAARGVDSLRVMVSVDDEAAPRSTASPATSRQASLQTRVLGTIVIPTGRSKSTTRSSPGSSNRCRSPYFGPHARALVELPGATLALRARATGEWSCGLVGLVDLTALSAASGRPSERSGRPPSGRAGRSAAGRA